MRWVLITLMMALVGCEHVKTSLNLNANGSGEYIEVKWISGKKDPQPKARSHETPGVSESIVPSTDPDGRTRMTRTVSFASLADLGRHFVRDPKVVRAPFSLHRVEGELYELRFQEAALPRGPTTPAYHLKQAKNWSFGPTRHDLSQPPDVYFGFVMMVVSSSSSDLVARLPGAVGKHNADEMNGTAVRWQFDGEKVAKEARQRWDALSDEEKIAIRVDQGRETNRKKLGEIFAPNFQGADVFDRVNGSDSKSTEFVQFSWPQGVKLIGDVWPPEVNLQKEIELNPPPLPEFRAIDRLDLLRVRERVIVSERRGAWATRRAKASWTLEPKAPSTFGFISQLADVHDGFLDEPNGSFFTYYQGSGHTGFSITAEIRLSEPFPESIPVIRGGVDLIYAHRKMRPIPVRPPGFGSYAMTWTDTGPELKLLRKGGRSVIIYCHHQSVHNLYRRAEWETYHWTSNIKRDDRSGDFWGIVDDAHDLEPGLAKMKNDMHGVAALVYRAAPGSKKRPAFAVYPRLLRSRIKFALHDMTLE